MDLNVELSLFFDYDVAEVDFYATQVCADALLTAFAGQLACPMPKYSSCCFGLLCSCPAASHQGLALSDHHAAVVFHQGLALSYLHATVAPHQGPALSDLHTTVASLQGLASSN